LGGGENNKKDIACQQKPPDFRIILSHNGPVVLNKRLLVLEHNHFKLYKIKR
jgi:hypothetical protein